MGYSLNALLDFARPMEILSHLMIGSEGTLGFIAEAVLRTVADPPLKYTGLLFFPDVTRACSAISALNAGGARALELMDRASLRSIENEPGLSAAIRDLSPEAAALLVEYACETGEELERLRQDCAAALPDLPLLHPPVFTTDTDSQALLWRVRKGLIPSVGAMRRRGTSFIIEDVVFPVERLAQGVRDLQLLFARHRYDDAFMNDLASVVVHEHGGALKAEHGTGRNMAPFVEAEWGREATALMRSIKQLVEPEVDLCIECGFCERVCPSRELTLTPRQRIVVRREMARLRSSGKEPRLLDELQRDFVYDGIDTCAVDGLCATACPVGIDTGKLVKRLRREARSDLSQEIAYVLATRLELVERAARLGLRADRLLRGWVGRGAMSAKDDLPGAFATAGEPSRPEGAAGVCLPSCVSRVLGDSRPEDGPGRHHGVAHRRRPCRLAALGPRRDGGALLRPALRLQGAGPGPPACGQPDRQRALALDERGAAAGRAGIQPLRPIAAGMRTRLDRTEPIAAREDADPGRDRLRPRPAFASSEPPPGRRHRRTPPGLLDPGRRLDRQARADRRRLRGGFRGTRGSRMLRICRGSGILSTGADSGGDPDRGSRGGVTILVRPLQQ